jgi:hypothetical protein
MILGSAKKLIESIVSIVLPIKEVFMGKGYASSKSGGSPLLWRNVKDVCRYFAGRLVFWEYQT